MLREMENGSGNWLNHMTEIVGWNNKWINDTRVQKPARDTRELEEQKNIIRNAEHQRLANKKNELITDKEVINN